MLNAVDSPRLSPALPKRLPPLDGLRGLAIVLVMFFHFGQGLNRQNLEQHAFRTLFDFGGSGVDLFFVLSGFLITGILLNSRHSDNYFSRFYMRRILRIFPLYCFSVLVVWLFVIPAEHPGVTADLRNKLIWNLGYVQNWRLDCVPHLGHYWSLAIEEQFYLIWPFVVWRFERQRVQSHFPRLA